MPGIHIDLVLDAAVVIDPEGVNFSFPRRVFTVQHYVHRGFVLGIIFSPSLIHREKLYENPLAGVGEGEFVAAGVALDFRHIELVRHAGAGDFYDFLIATHACHSRKAHEQSGGCPFLPH